MKNIIAVLLAAFLLAVASAPAGATSWYAAPGILVSNVCTNPQGAWFQFTDGSHGVVGSPCSWIINGIRFNGAFGG